MTDYLLPLGLLQQIFVEQKMLYKVIQKLDKMFSFAQALAYGRNTEHEQLDNNKSDII